MRADWATLPAPVKSLMEEWAQNPRMIHPWIREEPYAENSGVELYSIDLDMAAWSHISRPTAKHTHRSYWDSLADAMERFEELAPQIEWDNIPTLTEEWFCLRSKARCLWTPNMTAEELLRWIALTYGVSQNEMRDHMVPYFAQYRAGQSLNGIGQKVQNALDATKAVNQKFKLASPLVLPGKTLSLPALHQRNLALNGLTAADDAGPSGQTTTQEEPRPAMRTRGPSMAVLVDRILQPVRGNPNIFHLLFILLHSRFYLLLFSFIIIS
jgi:hypothetical protein